jgi:8-oxo-dGTP diphosphatase
MPKRVRVVAGVLVREGRVLIAKRRAGRVQAGLWEFPGGKLEEGESPEEGLARELLEELSIRGRIGGLVGVGVFEYPELEVELLGYWVHDASGEFSLRDHDELRWVSPDEMTNYSFAPADLPLLCPIRVSLSGSPGI